MSANFLLALTCQKRSPLVAVTTEGNGKMQRQLITVYRPNGMLGLGSDWNTWASYNVSYKRSRRLLIARASTFAQGRAYVISVWRLGNVYAEPDVIVHSDDSMEWCEFGSVRSNGLHYRNGKWSKV